MNWPSDQSLLELNSTTSSESEWTCVMKKVKERKLRSQTHTVTVELPPVERLAFGLSFMLGIGMREARKQARKLLFDRKRKRGDS